MFVFQFVVEAKQCVAVKEVNVIYNKKMSCGIKERLEKAAQ
jgi:hypothetical protein